MKIQQIQRLNLAQHCRIDRNTGKMTSAQDLTWNYANVSLAESALINPWKFPVTLLGPRKSQHREATGNWDSELVIPFQDGLRLPANKKDADRYVCVSIEIHQHDWSGSETLRKIPR
jgi:hypothetical protein